MHLRYLRDVFDQKCVVRKGFMARLPIKNLKNQIQHRGQELLPISFGERERGVGRDEMNLCEFPIALLAERVPKGMRTLEFQGQHGKLTVRGAEGLGLPTAHDTDVIIGLLQLTKTHNDFTNDTVPFTPHALMTLMGWPNQGHYYRRLRDSLNRWMGTTLFYEGAWYDNSLKRRVNASMHILDNFMMFDGASSFTWGKMFFQSCRANHLKRLDLDVYFGLKSSVTKQLYRFLDKRFYLKKDWTFGLRELAWEHVGLSRNYTDAKLKEKLKPALAELEGIGFLKGVDFLKVRGTWTVHLRGLGASESDS
jgi:hypothetical protein